MRATNIIPSEHIDDQELHVAPLDEDVSTVPAAFADVIGYHLRVAQEASFHAIQAGVDGSVVKPGWYTVLTILHAHPGSTPSELSRHCGRDRSTLTATLKDLATRGLITRRRKRLDQRSYTVRLTEKGMEMLERLREHSRLHDARLDAIIGLEDKPKFIAMLRKIAAEISVKDD